MTVPADVADRTLVLTRIFDAPRSLVFKAWTDAKQIAQWWGPQGFTTQYCQMDVRPGGAYRFCMRSPEGTDHWKVGVYREITPPERIVFTFAWEDAEGRAGHETLITVLFEAVGDQTRLTLRQAVFDTVEGCEGHHRGWTSCLERFAGWLSTQEEGR
jgi:uncharacterized protein YndB with AHSA1/START domain